ncbi:cupredoxin domain-containing protein [Effusibacillus lacus]|uniref:EfeO-type cupredoxin-like domain-containing protein n=1 Tax=Effusibacillus lacus TaxID=1348429 RepID=A0A292YD80_9BACL|nr:cupredoxin domain-containing protein [Effusibacillus lacus]GAX89882.1 hypothetical protein EFBL_1507 [Effusibacillus lacus]
MTGVVILSVVVMVVFSAFIVVLVNRYRKKLTCMAGMMIAMTSAMMASTLLGTVLGTYTDDMLIPTVAAVVIGMLVGYFTGNPVSLMAAMDGMLAGIMGGMMGAMLGVMERLQSPILMMLFVGLVYVVIMLFLVRLIREEAGVQPERAATGNRQQGTLRVTRMMIRFVWVLLPIALIFLIVMGNRTDAGSGSGVSSLPVIANWTSQSTQQVDITVKTGGYAPDKIVVKAGAPVQLNFHKDYEGGCLSYLLIKDFSITRKLNTGTTAIELPPLKPGTYPFMCGMQMYGGQIVVEP